MRSLLLFLLRFSLEFQTILMRRDIFKGFEKGDQIGYAVDMASLGDRFDGKIGGLQVIFDDVHDMSVPVFDGLDAKVFFIDDPEISGRISRFPGHHADRIGDGIFDHAVADFGKNGEFGIGVGHVRYGVPVRFSDQAEYIFRHGGDLVPGGQVVIGIQNEGHAVESGKDLVCIFFIDGEEAVQGKTELIQPFAVALERHETVHELTVCAFVRVRAVRVEYDQTVFRCMEKLFSVVRKTDPALKEYQQIIVSPPDFRISFEVGVFDFIG